MHMEKARPPFPAADHLLMQKSELSDEVERYVRERSRIPWYAATGTLVLGVFATVSDDATRLVAGVIWVLLMGVGWALYRGVSRQIQERRRSLATLEATH